MKLAIKKIFEIKLLLKHGYRHGFLFENCRFCVCVKKRMKLRYDTVVLFKRENSSYSN